MEEQQPHDSGLSPAEYSRRRMCQVFIGGMAGLSAGMVGFPLVSFMARPESLDLNKPLEISLDQLSPGQALYAEYRGQQLILLTGQAGTLVFSASCPHLGCNVAWDSANAVFHCPCHGAMFGADGQVIRGPVSSPLRRVPCEIKDGKVIISAEV
jgi:Rieske Fe-S protein